MPSRQFTPSPTPISATQPFPALRPHERHLIPPLTGSVAAAFSLLIALTLCFRKLTRKRTVPSDSKPPHRFSYSDLRRATSSFSPAHRLGQGGFGSVYRGTLTNNQLVAVKLMDAGSLQGEREFQNELFFAGNLTSDHILSVIGFSSNRKRRRMLLVYELMSNGSLQDCLLNRKCTELMEWKKRFSIAVEIAKGLEYIHHYCDPPVIHGDIKPSNILLDGNFNPKIADFGLARLKSENQCEISVNGGFEGKQDCNGGGEAEDNGYLIEEINQLPETFVRVPEPSPEMVDATTPSPRAVVAVASPSESRTVKDYVMEWIGNEIKEERPNGEWIGASSNSGPVGKSEKKKNKNKDNNVKKEKRRAAREWWKEEYCEELERKKKKKKKTGDDVNSENCWPKDEDLYVDRNKRSRSRSRSRSSWGSVDWWLDGLSGELWKARRSSHDSASGGISSTPSMRGTVCYIAPEYSGDGELSEKCDVYSFGVLLLVLIAGRRPLQVIRSPKSEYQRANLLSWARKLARAGKLIDLVDQSIQSLNKEQALLCITVALLCLQKSPARRPSMKEVVGMLLGELEPPQLPVELSPSPPSHFRSKSRKVFR